MAKTIATKRVYDRPEESDGFRVLVDRIWPRGLSKEKAAVDFWAKEIAPSTELRKWFHQDPERWEGFERRYRAELDAQSDRLKEVLDAAGHRPMTLLFGSKNIRRNQAVILKEVLENMR